MSRRFCFILFIGVLLEWKLALSAPAENGKTKEKGRAYEFGFSIEEQQHRHEKKDENGIVMGEFGFITADGIYHVTVYATDENGKFKIISMKNFPYGNPEKKIMIAMLPLAKKPEVKPTVVKSLKPDGNSCGGCVLPKKSNQLPADVMGKKPDDEKAVFRPLSKPFDNVSANGKANVGAVMGGKSTSTKSLSKTTASVPQSAGPNGKGSSASQKPLPKLPGSKPLIPPKISTPGDQSPNTIGATSSQVEPKIPANNGNENQLTNFLTQTTPTRIFTQISGINTPTTLLKQPNGGNQLSNFLVKKTGMHPLSTSTKHSRPSIAFGNSQAMYNTDSLTKKNPTTPFGLSIPNTNTKPQHSIEKTSPFTQNSRNDEINSIFSKNRLEINNRFGFSSPGNQIALTSHANKNSPPQVGGSLKTTKFPRPLVSPTIPFVAPTVLNTNTKSPSSLVSPSYNPNRSFTIPANNKKIQPTHQQGPINTFTQNAVKPILKNTKEPKPFQTLNKILPDSDGETPSSQLSPHTSTLISVPGNTVLQKPGQALTPAKATPQSIVKNTLTQPLMSSKTLAPKRLQQNTNEAKTSTTNSQSTNKQTPAAPPSQTKSKNTPSSNAGVGVGGASSSGSVDGGAGPLYRFKYVLDYNSHREEGRIDGSKEGNYNTIDDDGIRRIIDYIANENGYQPHIKLERLPPNELPTGKNKLKEYEFVWFT